MAKQEKKARTSFWVHLLYCGVALFLLMFVAGIAVGPDKVYATLTMIGNSVSNAAAAIVCGVVMVVLLIFCILSM